MCLHPNAGAGVCNKVISAHSIQRSSVLERIVDSSNHVLSFYPPSLDTAGRLKIQPVGWREASTFTGFCAKHDSLVFHPLEREEFRGTERQTFLAGYRALCHELFQRSASLRSGRVMDDFLHAGRADRIQALAIKFHDSFNASVEAGLEQLRECKRSADEHLLNEEYSAFSSMVITFSGELCIASTGAVSPHQDFAGAELQSLQNLEERIQGLFCTTLTTKDGGAVVFSWPRTSAGPKFVSSLITKSGDDLASFFGAVLFYVCGKHVLFAFLVEIAVGPSASAAGVFSE